MVLFSYHEYIGVGLNRFSSSHSFLGTMYCISNDCCKYVTIEFFIFVFLIPFPEIKRLITNYLLGTQFRQRRLFKILSFSLLFIIPTYLSDKQTIFYSSILDQHNILNSPMNHLRSYLKYFTS